MYTQWNKISSKYADGSWSHRYTTNTSTTFCYVYVIWWIIHIEMIITFIKIFCSSWFPFPNLNGTYGCWTQFWWCGRVYSQFTWRVIWSIPTKLRDIWIWIWIYCCISRKPCTSSRQWFTTLIKKPSRNLENIFNSNIIISNNLKTLYTNNQKKKYKGRVKSQILKSTNNNIASKSTEQ